MADPQLPASPAEPSRGPWRALFIVAAIVLAIVLVVLVLLLTVFRPGASPAPTPTPTPSSASPTPTPTPTATAGGTCTAANVKVTLGQPSGTAGSTVLPIIFTNHGTTSCTMNGYPVVEFVGDGNGTQIGPAAAHDTTVAPMLTTLPPGGGAGTMVTIADAGNVCSSPVPTDGFRVITPGSTDAVFVATTAYPACPGTQGLLTVTAIAGP